MAVHFLLCDARELILCVTQKNSSFIFVNFRKGLKLKIIGNQGRWDGDFVSGNHDFNRWPPNQVEIVKIERMKNMQSVTKLESSEPGYSGDRFSRSGNILSRGATQPAWRESPKYLWLLRPARAARARAVVIDRGVFNTQGLQTFLPIK